MQNDKCYLYILESEINKSLYIGQSNNVEKRLEEHNNGYNKSTKSKRPWRLIFSLVLVDRSEAIKLERKLKSWKKRKSIFSWIDKQNRGVAQPG